ncbi:MAG: hypothetical protein ACYC4R_17000 [Anaerolineae bacterium]
MRIATPRRLTRVLGAALILLPLFILAPGSTLAQSPNLLQNPGFEAPYVAYPGKENCRIAAPWQAYWYEGPPEETSQGLRLAPEFKAAFRIDYPGNRVRNGDLSQQWFHSWGNFEGGVYQQVSGITPGTNLRFELWGMTWSCDNARTSDCSNAKSGNPSPMRFRIGIDPTGGTDAHSGNIVWSPEQNAYDAWTLFQVDAVAQAGTVTVFAYTYPEYRSQNNDVYIDDASLIALAPPPTNTPLPTNTPAPTNTPSATYTPTEAPTATPTLTPEATATPEIIDTPVPSPTATTEPTQIPTVQGAGLPTPVPVETATTAAAPDAAGSSTNWLLIAAGVVSLAVVAVVVRSRLTRG